MQIFLISLIFPISFLDHHFPQQNTFQLFIMLQSPLSLFNALNALSFSINILHILSLRHHSPFFQACWMHCGNGSWCLIDVNTYFFDLLIHLPFHEHSYWALILVHSRMTICKRIFGLFWQKNCKMLLHVYAMPLFTFWITFLIIFDIFNWHWIV